MPIIVKDFTWTQTATTIQIRIPVSPVNHEKVDIFTTDSYVKAHYSPFFFDVFLLHDVENKKSKCTVKDDLITFDLVKREEIDWECLEKEMSKGEKLNRKVEFYKKSQDEAKQEFEDRSVRKSQLDRFTVQQAMQIDTKQHALMDSRRDEQRNKTMDALEEWRLKTEDGIIPRNVNTTQELGVKIIELPSSEGDINVKTDVSKQKPQIKKVVPKKPPKTPVKSEYIDKKKEETSKRVLPKLRKTAEVQIKHTPRTFPTPSRESTADEEEAWLKNVTLARRATGFVSEDLRPEEQDPQWCKEKGDEFFRSGNFLGAISAYTHGITLSDKLPSLFANRSATHFALGNFNKCVNDCSTAIDLMKPPCESNRRSRAKCIARRAAALARLGYLNKAIDEMKVAAKLLPEDENINKDVYDMERAWEQNPDSD